MTDSLLSKVRAVVDGARVPYMIVGSFASSFHGTPRSTHDLDIVIDPTREGLLALLERFPASDDDVSHEAAFDALSARSQFHVVDDATGWKIDFIFLKSREFSREEFGRRSSVERSGITLDTATAEDSILSKLEWAKLAPSDRQIDDVVGILRMQGETLDVPYIERWTRELDLVDMWLMARATAAKSALS